MARSTVSVDGKQLTVIRTALSVLIPYSGGSAARLVRASTSEAVIGGSHVVLRSDAVSVEEPPPRRDTQRRTASQLAVTIGLVVVLLGLSVLAWFAVAESLSADAGM